MRLVGQLDRLAKQVQDSLRNQLRCGVESHRIDEHHKLVTAETTDGVVVSEGAPESGSDLAQDLIAGLVAVAVVDLLEAVDVDEQRGDRYVEAARAGKDLFGTVENEGPVGQIGERVVQRGVLELAGLLSHQAPRAPAGSREHNIEQEYEQRDEHAETQREGTPCAG